MAAPTASKDFSSLTALAATPATGDYIFLFDVSEGTATNKPKRCTVAELGGLFATAAQGSTADSALQDVVDDATPQLGGDLDVNGNDIVSASNGDITITPNGSGRVVASALNAAYTINAQVGTTYAPALTDAGNVMITLTNGSAIAVTIPANASVAFPVGSVLNFYQGGAGAVTIGITSDTLSYDSALTAVLNGQHAVVSALKLTSTSWVLFGNLTAA